MRSFRKEFTLIFRYDNDQAFPWNTLWEKDFIIVLFMVRGHHPPERFEIQVLGNAISDVLRPSNSVLRSRFFKPKCHSFASKYCKTTLKRSKWCIRIQICILQFLWRQRFQFRGLDRTPRPPLDPPQLLLNADWLITPCQVPTANRGRRLWGRECFRFKKFVFFRVCLQEWHTSQYFTDQWSPEY